MQFHGANIREGFNLVGQWDAELTLHNESKEKRVPVAFIL